MKNRNRRNGNFHPMPDSDPQRERNPRDFLKAKIIQASVGSSAACAMKRNLRTSAEAKSYLEQKADASNGEGTSVTPHRNSSPPTFSGEQATPLRLNRFCFFKTIAYSM